MAMATQRTPKTFDIDFTQVIQELAVAEDALVTARDKLILVTRGYGLPMPTNALDHLAQVHQWTVEQIAMCEQSLQQESTDA